MEKIIEALRLCEKNNFVSVSFCNECPYCKTGCSLTLAEDIAKFVGIEVPQLLYDCTIEQLEQAFFTGVVPIQPKRVRKVKVYDATGRYYYQDEAV